MCGIAGFFDPKRHFSRDSYGPLLKGMGDAIAHRGPDDASAWSDAETGVGFSFRRLAILDLSETGRQPMRSVSGRYTLMLNGEIYNYRELKKELEATGSSTHPFRGTSDTEVLLAGIEVWGLATTLEKTNGMFAIALWDQERRELCLARDRMGEKPLYYGIVNGTFLFGSELKALFAVPGFKGTLDKEALHQFFRTGYIPGPLSIFEEVRKLTPGTWLRVREDLVTALETEFWSVADAARAGLENPFSGTIGEGEQRLESLLSDSVAKRMISDVPLGAFLSGGVDSSLVVALMQKHASAPVKTYTIGFQESDYDESSYAAAVAKHLGTDHVEHKLSAQETFDLIPQLATWYDEPLADASQLPTYLVSRLARKSVTVALSGDGGDELFAGYPRYVWGEKIGEISGLIPGPLRQLFGQGMDFLPPGIFEKGLAYAKEIFPMATVGNNAAEKARKLVELIKDNDAASVYRTLTSQWADTAALLGGEAGRPLVGRAADLPATAKTLLDKMMYWDQTTYLCDDVLAKVDRASMAVGLEARVPLLDHRVVELAWSFPKEWKLELGTTKAILRRMLYRHVPKELLERPKQGFSLPIDHWLKKELRPWAEELLGERRLLDSGVLDAEPVRALWKSHLEGSNHQQALWSVLIFQQWLEKYGAYVAR